MEQVTSTSAYMWALIVMAAAFLLAVIISNLILFKPNNPGTTKRRISFWSLCIASVSIGFIINYFIGRGITVPSMQQGYLKNSVIAAVICFILYIIIGFVISKLFPKSKVGTWF